MRQIKVEVDLICASQRKSHYENKNPVEEDSNFHKCTVIFMKFVIKINFLNYIIHKAL